MIDRQLALSIPLRGHKVVFVGFPLTRIPVSPFFPPSTPLDFFLRRVDFPHFQPNPSPLAFMRLAHAHDPMPAVVVADTPNVRHAQFPNLRDQPDRSACAGCASFPRRASARANNPRDHRPGVSARGDRTGWRDAAPPRAAEAAVAAPPQGPRRSENPSGRCRGADGVGRSSVAETVRTGRGRLAAG